MAFPAAARRRRCSFGAKGTEGALTQLVQQILFAPFLLCAGSPSSLKILLGYGVQEMNT